MTKKVFISYDFADKSFKGEVAKWLKEEGVRVISTDENDLRPQGENAIERKIREEVKSAQKMLILVGNNTHNRPWIDYEISIAGSLQMPRFWVRLPKRTGAPPKEVRGNIRQLNYNKEDILFALR